MIEKIEYLRETHDKMKIERRLKSQEIPYVKMDKRDNYHMLCAEIQMLTNVLMLFKHGFTIEQMKQLEIDSRITRENS